MNWKLRLKQVRAAHPIYKKKVRFAEAVGVSTATTTDWEKSVEDGGIATINGPNLTKVCDVLGIEPDWLLDERGPQWRSDKPRGSVEQPLASYVVPKNKFRSVPVFGKGMGGVPDRIWGDGDYPVGASDKEAEVATQDPNAFITLVEGGSMIPRYNPGEYALVEPNTEPELEDDVLVRFKNDGTSIKRLLSRRDGFIRLGSYNDKEIIACSEEEIVWIYYVAHPVPSRKIKNRT